MITSSTRSQLTNDQAAPSIERQVLHAQPAPPRHTDSFVRYLPVALSGVRDPLCVTGVGAALVRPGDAYPQVEHPNIYQFEWRSGRVLPEHQLLLLNDAHGEFESRETGLVRIEGPTLILLFPGVWHRYRPDRAVGWREQWLSVHGPLADHLFERSGASPHSAVRAIDNADRLTPMFDRLIGLAHATPVCQSAELQREATRVVAEGLGVSLSDAQLEQLAHTDWDNAQPDDIINQARQFIWSAPHKRPLCVSDVARRLPITRRTLDRRFAQVLGHSVLDEINACRLSRAKRMLVETNFLVKTVSYLAGFPSRERMRLLFLNVEGVTPTEYREQSLRSGGPAAAHG